MDPVGAAASVLAIADAAFKVIQIIRALKHATEERTALRDEVSNAHKLLLGIHDQLSNTDPDGNSPWFQAITSLFAVDGELKILQRILEQIVQKLNISPETPWVKVKLNAKWLIDRKDTQELTERVYRSKINISVALTRATVLLGKETLSISKDTNSQVKNLRESVDANQFDQVVQWVSPLDFRTQQSHKRALQQTCERFLKSLAFTGWADARAPSLWCRGMPGAGKTYFASAAYNQLCSQNQGANALVMIVFCAFDDTNTHTAEGIMLSLLRQVLESRKVMSTAVNHLHQKCQDAGHSARPTFNEVKDALKAELMDAEKPFVIIDGLDEMPEETQRRHLLDSLETLHPRLQLMVSSRSLEDIRLWFSSSEKLHRCAFAPPAEPMDNFDDSVDEDALDASKREGVEMKVFQTCDGCGSRVLTTSDSRRDIVLSQRVCYRCDNQSCGCLSCALCYDQYDVCLGCKAHKSTYKYIWPQELIIAAQPYDLKLYVDHRISEKKELERKIERAAESGINLRDEITVAIVASAREMFLLARLQMDSITKLATPNQIRTALSNLPNEINEVFDQVYQRINAFDVAPHIRRLVTLVAFARVPLTTLALEHAIAVETGNVDIDPMDLVDGKELVNKSLGLLTIDSADKIRISHETVREYVRRQSFSQDRSEDDSLASICLTYLHRSSCLKREIGPEYIHRLANRNIKYPLLSYAAMYWGVHVRFSKHKSTHSLAYTCLSNREWVDAVAQLMWYDDLEFGTGWDADRGVCGLHVAAHFGLIDETRFLLSIGEPVNANDSLGTTPLMYAISSKFQDVVAVLLEAHANTSVCCKRGFTALHRACKAADTAIVKQLVQSSGDISINKLDHLDGLSALHMAVSFINLNIVTQLLTRKGIDVNLVDGTSWKTTPLHLAVKRGYLGILQTLLKDDRIIIDSMDSSKRTPLTLACTYDDADAAEVLLDNGANLNELGGFSMLRAAYYGRLSVLQLLIDRGVDYQFKNQFRRGVLHSAASTNQSRILRYLLQAKNDLDLNAQGSRGETPLHDAASRGFKSSVKVLLEFGARTDVRDNEGRSPLRAARENNQERVLHYLVTARMKEMSSAADKPLRLDESTDLTTLPPPYQTVNRVDTLSDDIELTIHLAVCTHDAQQLKEYLHKLGPNLQASLSKLDNDAERTPLHVAVAKRPIEIVQVLLEQGADPNATTRQGVTALHTAAIYDHIDAAKLLLEYQAAVDLKDRVTEGRTALDLALEYRSRVARVTEGRTALDFAPEDRRRVAYQFACLMIQHDSTLAEHHPSALVPLMQYAVEHNELKVVERLCTHGVPCHFRVGSRLTPYEIAKKKGYVEMATFLLGELQRRQQDSPLNEEEVPLSNEETLNEAPTTETPPQGKQTVGDSPGNHSNEETVEEVSGKTVLKSTSALTASQALEDIFKTEAIYNEPFETAHAIRYLSVLLHQLRHWLSASLSIREYIFLGIIAVLAIRVSFTAYV